MRNEQDKLIIIHEICFQNDVNTQGTQMIVQAKHHVYLQQEMGNIQYLKEL